MKITCKFCGTLFDDVEERCPHCNGENPNVRKGDISNPTTIEELAKWYEQRNLPPYDVTRFFIGIDTKEAKAFGIYRDGDNVVVYKNKDNGTRAVRYEGTDEAFGVNELFMRLKQEILNQKSLNNGSKDGTTVSVNGAMEDKESTNSSNRFPKLANSNLILLSDPWELLFEKATLNYFLILALVLSSIIVFVGLFEGDKLYKIGIAVGFLVFFANLGAAGFYFVRMFLSWLVNCVGYGIDIIKGFIFVIIQGVISCILLGSAIMSGWTAIDLISYPKWHVKQGYYISQVDRDPYYFTYQWYYYDGETLKWELCDDETRPRLKDFVFDGNDEMVSTHDFDTIDVVYEGEEYSPAYSFPNFLDSVAYNDEVTGYKVGTGYYNYNDDIYYHLKESSYSDWYYYDNTSNDWTTAEESEVPDDLKHQMVAEDFWFTPTWDSSTQFSDFEESAVYSEYLEEEAAKESSSSDSSYDWGSSDSWDSGSTDWGSDW